MKTILIIRTYQDVEQGAIASKKVIKKIFNVQEKPIYNGAQSI